MGEQVDSIIVSVDKKTRSLNLSIKEIEIIDEKEAMSKYGSRKDGYLVFPRMKRLHSWLH